MFGGLLERFDQTREPLVPLGRREEVNVLQVAQRFPAPDVQVWNRAFGQPNREQERATGLILTMKLDRIQELWKQARFHSRGRLLRKTYYDRVRVVHRPAN